jgi:dipeptidyl aminopeptidase/acylaminoacyl peptidase
MTIDTSRESLPKLIAVEEFFAEPEFAVPMISPDGTRIAYLAPHLGRRNIWVRGVDQTHDDAVPVTSDARRGITTYYWTDDPRWLLYLQDTDGNEDWHLHRVDLDAPDEPATDLTPMGTGSRVFAVEPLPSAPGSVLAWMNQRTTHIDIFRIDIATGETVLHHEQADDLAGVLLDRVGEPAFHVLTEQDGTIVVSGIDRATGALRLLKRMGGAEYPLGVQPQVVTPDGDGLLVGSFSGGDDLRLVRIDRETGDETVVAAVEGRSLDIMDVMAPGVLPPALYTDRGTGEVLAARFVGARPHIEVVDPGFAEIHAELATLSDGVLGTLSSDTSGRRWIATFIDDREPGVSWFYDHATGQRRRLFQPYPDLVPADLAPMAAVRFPARDGLELPGYLTLPVGVPPRNLPMVLLVHGGPWSQDGWGYHPEVQLLANRGYAVLQVNFRGSIGYGRRHVTGAVGEFGRAMQDDLVDAVDWAVTQSYADPARIGIYGPLLRRLCRPRRDHRDPRPVRRRRRLRGRLRPRSRAPVPAAVHPALQRQQLVPLHRRPRRAGAGGRHAGPLAHHHGRSDPYPAARRPRGQRRPRAASAVRSRRCVVARARRAGGVLARRGRGTRFREPGEPAAALPGRRTPLRRASGRPHCR